MAPTADDRQIPPISSPLRLPSLPRSSPVSRHYLLCAPFESHGKRMIELEVRVEILGLKGAVLECGDEL